MKNRKCLALGALSLLVVQLACVDSDLRKISKALTDVALSIGTLQTAVIEAQQADLVSVETTSQVLSVCKKVNLAEREAVVLTRVISKLDAPAKAQILQILTPVITSVQTLAANGALGIKNPATEQKVQAILLSVRTGLNTIQLIVAGGK